MTNIALTFSQGHHNHGQTFYHASRNAFNSVPAVDFLGLSKKIVSVLDGGLVGDIYLLLTSPLQDTSSGGGT